MHIKFSFDTKLHPLLIIPHTNTVNVIAKLTMTQWTL